VENLSIEKSEKETELANVMNERNQLFSNLQEAEGFIEKLRTEAS
jgi:uncharacterized protein (DUF2384 family)